MGKRDWRVLLHFLEMAERGEVDVGRQLADAELAVDGIGKLGRDALRAEVRGKALYSALYCHPGSSCPQLGSCLQCWQGG